MVNVCLGYLFAAPHIHYNTPCLLGEPMHHGTCSLILVSPKVLVNYFCLQGMDATNERLIFELLGTTASEKRSQYILLTPKVSHGYIFLIKLYNFPANIITIKLDKKCIKKKERVRHLPGYCP